VYYCANHTITTLVTDAAEEENRTGEGRQAGNAVADAEKSATSMRPRRVIQPNKKYASPGWPKGEEVV
jgi:hypothetical protein